MKTYIVSDIHGHYDKLVHLLQRKKLLDEHLMWTERPVHLIFLGDYFDRGPNGVRVVDLIMRLQIAAKNTNGCVDAILGNHDIFILGAHRFQNHSMAKTFFEVWMDNGGVVNDLKSLTKEHVQWLLDLPIMLYVKDNLLIHSDSMFYLNYGTSTKRVNRLFKSLLKSNDVPRWIEMMRAFTQRDAFKQTANARALLKVFGGKRIIHGHTPIHVMTGQEIKTIKSPLAYADNLCVNLDGGMAYGGQGFVYLLRN